LSGNDRLPGEVFEERIAKPALQPVFFIFLVVFFTNFLAYCVPQLYWWISGRGINEINLTIILG